MKNLLNSKLSWIGALILASAAIFFFNSDAPAATSATNLVETETISRGNITRSIAATGRVRALVTVEVGSQLSGKVDELYVDFNDEVKKDDIVAAIDPQTFEQRVLQAQADLESAKANVRVQQATVTRAVTTLAQAERDFKRQEPLARDGAISTATLDATRSIRDAATASLEIAKAQVESANASAQQREAALKSAEIDLNRTKIKSPIDGVVIERNVDRGQTVAASLSAPTLFKIAQDLTEIQIEASVDESDIGRVRAGNSVSFTVDAHEDQTFRGTVDQVRLSPTELNNVVTYTVIVNASNRRLLLLPGMTANLEINTGERADVLRLPNQALRIRPTEAMKATLAAAPAEQGERTSRRGTGGPGGRGGMTRLLEQLDIDAATTETIRTETRQLFQQMRGQMQQSPDRNAAREQMRAKMQKILEANLSPDQMKKLQALQREQAEIRRAQIWVRDAAGEIAPLNVRIGISDTSFTEVLGGSLEEGAEVITRIRQARK